MTAKLHTVLSTILLLLTFTLTKCEPSGLGGINATIGKGDVTIIASPTVNSKIRGGDVFDTMHAVRHLDGGEQNIHIRTEPSSFTFKMPYSIVAAIIVYFASFVVFLLLRKVMLDEEWNFFKSAFLVVNTQLYSSTDPAKQYTRIGSSSKNNKREEDPKEQTTTLLADISVPSIACGAIMSTLLILVIPEAMLLVQRGTSSYEGEIEILPGTISRTGIAIMVGYVLNLVMEALFSRSTENISIDEGLSLSPSPSDLDYNGVNDSLQKVIDEEEKTDEDGDSGAHEQELKIEKIGSDDKTRIDEDSIGTDEQRQNYRHRLSIIILISSAVHNIFDGIFIGAAFMTCSTATAVSITVITVYREISHKVKDYLLLTKCCLDRAAIFNFVSGSTIILGAVIFLVTDAGELTTGVFLAIASGVYLHISASECLPYVYSVVKNPRERIPALFLFVIGALPIAFTFLSHEHCDV